MTSEEMLQKLLNENADEAEKIVQEENWQFDDHLGAIIGQREDAPKEKK